jgi:hypothetical protein
LKNAYKILVQEPNGGGHFEEVDENGKIILKWNIKGYRVTMWTATDSHKLSEFKKRQKIS